MSYDYTTFMQNHNGTDYAVTVKYDDDMSLDDLMGELVGIAFDTHEYRRDIIGDQPVVELLPTYFDDLEYFSEEVNDCTEEMNKVAEVLSLEVSRRVEDLDAIAEALTDLKDAEEKLDLATEELRGYMESRPDVLHFRYHPYVDTHGITAIVNVPEFCANTGLARERLATIVPDMAKTLNTVLRGGVWIISLEEVILDEDGEIEDYGSYSDSIGGVILEDDCPTDEEFWTFILEEMGLKN